MPPKLIPEADLAMFPLRGDGTYREWKRRVELMYREFLTEPVAVGRLQLRVIANLTLDLQQEICDDNIQTWNQIWTFLLKLDKAPEPIDVFAERVEIVGPPSTAFKKYFRKYSEAGFTESMLLGKIKRELTHGAQQYLTMNNIQSPTREQWEIIDRLHKEENDQTTKARGFEPEFRDIYTMVANVRQEVRDMRGNSNTAWGPSRTTQINRNNTDTHMVGRPPENRQQGYGTQGQAQQIRQIITCFICGKQGHRAAQCWYRMQGTVQGQNNNGQRFPNRTAPIISQQRAPQWAPRTNGHYQPQRAPQQQSTGGYKRINGVNDQEQQEGNYRNLNE